MNYVFVVILFLLTINVDGQQSGLVINGSFESISSDIPNWNFSGKDNNPDVIYGIDAFWKIFQKPEVGICYLLLVTRDNGTSESIFQKLERKLIKDKQYKLSVSLSTSKSIISWSRKTNIKVRFDNSNRIRISYGKNKRQKKSIIEVTSINHENWQKYECVFQPNEDSKYIFIEILQPENGESVNSNLLIDNLLLVEF